MVSHEEVDTIARQQELAFLGQIGMVNGASAA